MSKIIIGTLRPPLATNATAGIIKGGDDITIGTGGEPVVNTNYDTVDINTDANIQNIVKGMKFKSILGNIVSALMGLNGDVSKINSDLTALESELSSSSNTATTAGPKFTNYTSLYKFGSFYVLDVLVVASNGYVAGDVVCTFPITPKKAVCRYLAGNNGYSLQCGVNGNKLIAENSNNATATYGGLILLM